MPVNCAVDLPLLLVEAAAYAVFASVVTRSGFFAFGFFSAFWLFIFSVTYFSTCSFTSVYVSVPFIVLFGAFVGTLFAKVVNLPVFIHFGLAYGPPQYRQQPLAPWLFLGLVYSFISVGLYVACSAVVPLFFIFQMSAPTKIVLLVAFLLLTILFLGLSCVDLFVVPKADDTEGVRWSLGYLYVAILLILVQSIIWDVAAFTSAVGAWVFAVGVFVSDLLFLVAAKFAIGVFSNPSKRPAVYSVGDWVRLALVSLVHASVFIVGFYSGQATGNDVERMVFDGLASFSLGLYFILLLGVLFLIYACVGALFMLAPNKELASNKGPLTTFVNSLAKPSPAVAADEKASPKDYIRDKLRGGQKGQPKFLYV